MSSDALKALFDLINATRGAQLTDVSIEEFPGAGRGVRVGRPISSGQVAIGIPGNFVITATSTSPCLSDDSEAYRKWIRKIANSLSGAELLAVVLLRLLERARTDLEPCDWRALYLRTLPVGYSTISYWPEKDRKIFCAASSLLAEKFGEAERTRKNFCEKIRDVTGERYSMEEIVWAYWTIETRGCYHRVGGVCLVPIGDMVNHSALAYSKADCGGYGMNCGNYNVREHRYEFTAMRGYTEGEQLYVVYSRCSSTDLLLRYGFSTLSDSGEISPFESVEIRAKELRSPRKSVEELIRSGIFVGADGCLSHSFATTARLKIARNHGITASLENVVHGDELGNAEHEREARELCGAVMEQEILKHTAEIQLCFFELGGGKMSSLNLKSLHHLQSKVSAAVPKALKKKEGRYFHANKRSEVHEMKEELHSHDKHKQKDAIKRVIANMTLGKDVSSLFPDMVQCMQSNQMEIKKLVYLYVLNYAKSQPELAVLAVNTFMKDAGDPNPLIRALALRTMGCIRLDQICEYLLEPLRRCCRDQDPYVRKTAAICVSKVWEINPEVVEDQGFIEILRDMTGDRNPVVVANAVASLLELGESKEDPSVLGMNSGMVEKLLGALNDCTEWGQVMLLDGIAHYTPSSSQDAEGVIERVTARLSHANPAVVMAAVRVLMCDLDKVTDSAFVQQIVKKLHPPLVSLLSNPPEIQYVAIRNLNLIVQKWPQVINSDVKIFFCRYTDPIYLKIEKVDMMVRLCNSKNADQVLSEFKEYAADVDVDFSRKAVRAIGRVAVEVNGVARKAMPVLLELINMKVNHIVQEAVVVVADILRKYHIEYEQAITALCDNLESLDQPEAKASMIWILGEYAEHIENVDTVLGTFLEYFADEPVSVQLQLLTAIVKLFLKCPDIGEPMVTQVLQLCTEYSSNPDLRDRGYLYWRLLSTDPELAKQVVLCDKPE
ncbi:hypothetical protein FOL47_007975, partial [Perkinsus chesapeaki]